MVTAGITIILVLLLILVLYKTVLNKVKYVGKSIKTLSSENADLTVRVPVKGHDEFSELGSDVNQFINTSSQSVFELAQNTKENIQVMDSLLRQFTA